MTFLDAEGALIRFAIILISIICLLLILFRSRWKEMSRGQLFHWQAVILLMFAAAYGASEALLLNLPGGSRLLVVLVAVLYLLASLILRGRDGQDNKERRV